MTQEETIRRLENDYKFECEAGLLKDCVEWISLKNQREADEVLIGQLAHALRHSVYRAHEPSAGCDGCLAIRVALKAVEGL